MITRLIAILALLLVTVGADAKHAKAQCTGNFPSNSVCGNATTTTGQARPTALSSFTGGGGGGGVANITRAQIPSTNLNGVTSITVNGYAAAYDAGYGATYSTNGAFCPNGWGSIKDVNGTCFNLVLVNNLVPGWFGAKADNGATTISSGDISAHTEWRGSYSAGQTWDYVGVQEWVYAAFAQNSFPGTIQWNSVVGAIDSNFVAFVPCGNYGLNATVTAVIQGFTIRGAGRQCALFNWTGTATNETLWLFNSATYGLLENFSVECNVAQNYGSQNPCVSFDNTSSPGGLKTQQLTFVNSWVVVGQNGEGLSINRVAGGGGQGDTITFINGYFAGDQLTAYYGLLINGANSLEINMVGGDCQSFVYSCILNSGGVLYTHGMHFEMQNPNQLTNGPLLNQIVNGGADVNSTGGNGGNGSVTVASSRSEAEVLANALSGAQVSLYSDIVTSADNFTWFSNGSMQPGTFTIAGTKNRGFILVDGGGFCKQWCAITSSTSSTLTDSSASYTVNSLTSLVVWARFGSNGFITKCGISSNTATVITVSGCSLSSENVYTLIGRGGATAPSWDTATAGGSNLGGNSHTITTSSGSNCIELSTGFLSTNNWVVLPFADKVVPAHGATWPNTLYAQVTGTSSSACSWGGSGPSATLDRNANQSVTPNIFYTGTTLTDNNLTWIEIPYNAAEGVAAIVDFKNGSGLIDPVGGSGPIMGLQNGSSGFNPINTGNGNNIAANPPQPINNYIPGNISTWQCALTAASTIDLTNCVASASVVILSMSGNSTLNAPAPNSLMQYLTLLFKGDGNTITFGTNFTSNGTLPTQSNTLYAVSFISNNNLGTPKWQEISRSTVNAAGTNAVTATPAGPNSTSSVTMQGLAGTITPVKTGNISITISGYVISSNTAAGDGLTNQISYGTGTAPTSNAALAGTQVGGIQQYLNPTTVTAADVSQPFSLTVQVTGLTLGTAYWIDLASEAIAHTGLANKQVDIAVHEF